MGDHGGVSRRLYVSIDNFDRNDELNVFGLPSKASSGREDKQRHRVAYVGSTFSLLPIFVGNLPSPPFWGNFNGNFALFYDKKLP